MKKRILAFALSLSLAVSLAAPALAAEPEDNDYTMELSDLMELLEGNMDPALLEQYLEAQYGDDWYQTENGAWSIQWPEEKLSLVVNGQNYPTTTLTGEDGVSYLSGAALDAIFGGKLGITDPTPIPIRPAAEEAGWDVTWNEWNHQVVLLDRESLLKGVLAPSGFREEWDNAADPEEQFIKNILGEPDEKGLFTQDFSRFDEMMTRLQAAGKGLEGKPIRTTHTFDLTLTAFNSLDGDEKYTVTVKADLLMNDRIANLTLTADLAQLWKLLPQNVKDKVAANLPKVTFQSLPTLLTGCKAQFILNMEEETLYWNIPLLSLFDSTVSENAWGKVDLSDRLGVVVAVEREPVTDWNTAQRLCDHLLEESAASYWGAEDAYTDFARDRILMNLILGNDRIARRGDALTWSLSADALTSYMALEDGYVDLENLTAADLFRELDLSLSVEKDGRYSLTAALRPDMDAIAARYTGGAWYDASEAALMTWIMNLLDFRMRADAAGTANRSTGNMEFHWKNQFKLELKTSSQRQTNAGDPLSAPPAGADVIELY